MTNVARRPPEQVAYHLTLHVVKAWVEAGELLRARRAYDQLPLGLEPGPSWREVEHRLLDAEEAMMLGVAVYPSEVPIPARWVRPRVAPPRRRGRALSHWFPGRVVAASPEEVTLAMATPEADPAERRVISRVVDAAHWSTICDWATAAEAEGYVEVAQYEGDDDVVVLSAPSDTAASAAPVPHPMRYLLRRTVDARAG